MSFGNVMASLMRGNCFKLLSFFFVFPTFGFMRSIDCKYFAILSIPLKHSFLSFTDNVALHIVWVAYEHFIRHFGLLYKHWQPTGEKCSPTILRPLLTHSLLWLSAPERPTLWWWVNKLVKFMLFCCRSVCVCCLPLNLF